VYKALILPVILHRSENLTVRQKDEKRLSRDEIFQKNSGTHTFGHRRNAEILEELKVEPADEKLIGYKSNWPRHVTRINHNMVPKIMLNCGPNGRRRRRRPVKKLLDEAETGLSRHNW
jgi:hypothetical protein